MLAVMSLLVLRQAGLGVAAWFAVAVCIWGCGVAFCLGLPPFLVGAGAGVGVGEGAHWRCSWDLG